MTQNRGCKHEDGKPMEAPSRVLITPSKTSHAKRVSCLQGQPVHEVRMMHVPTPLLKRGCTRSCASSIWVPDSGPKQGLYESALRSLPAPASLLSKINVVVEGRHGHSLVLAS